MQDSWEAGDPYDYYMGRWSRPVARLFIDWLSQPAGQTWLDVGCGAGALSEAILNTKPAGLSAVDQSEGFVNTAQKRLGTQASCKIGNALALPLEDSCVNVAVAGLVLNFIPEPTKALVEMRRVTTPGGTVAVYVWDYAGKMDFLNYFWDTALGLNPDISKLHEGRRFPECNADGLKVSFKHAGLLEIETAPIETVMNFRDFDDYWVPFLGGQGPAPTYVLSLAQTDREKLRNALLTRLPIQADGSVSLVARAWAVRGSVLK